MSFRLFGRSLHNHMNCRNRSKKGSWPVKDVFIKFGAGYCSNGDGEDDGDGDRDGGEVGEMISVLMRNDFDVLYIYKPLWHIQINQSINQSTNHKSN